MTDITTKGSAPARVLHIVPDLWTGGAEVMLAQLIEHTDTAFEHRLLSLRSLGDIGPRLEAAGIHVEALNIHGWLAAIFKLFRLRRVIRNYRPDIVHTWLYQGNVAGGLAARLSSDARVVWELHCGPLESSKYRTRLIRWLGGKLSAFIPDRIICCANSVKEAHAELGYADCKMLVIPNGIDTERFSGDKSAGERLRTELNVSESQFLVGLIGRHDRQKDFSTFLNAAEIALKQKPNLRFLLCGRGFEPERESVKQALDVRSLHPHVTCLGFRADIPSVMAALDALAISSSYGEALPLVAIEAMASGIPIIATDIGDIKQAVADAGLTVPVRSPQSLASAILHYASLSEDDYRSVQAYARERAVQLFSVNATVERRKSLYLQLSDRMAGAVVTQGCAPVGALAGQD